MADRANIQRRKGVKKMSEDRCVICGEIIPEGRMICPDCEAGKVSLTIGDRFSTAQENKKKTEMTIEKAIDILS